MTTVLRALRCEFEVHRSYIGQIAMLGILICGLLSAATQAFPMLPGVLSLTFFFSCTVTLGTQDETNGWGSFRLALPLSRRAIVVARYLFIVLAGLGGMALGAALAAAELALCDLAGISSVDGLFADAQGLAVLQLLTPFFFLAGSGVLGVAAPFFFRLGASKATQYLPFAILVVGMLPFFALSLFGEGGDAALLAVIEKLGRSSSLAAASATLAALSVAVLVASALVSVRLYERRDL